MYQLKVVQLSDQTTQTIEVTQKQCLHHLLVNMRGYNAPCGGNKACQKCKVKIVEDIPYSQMEQEVLTQEEMENHIHLACLTYIEQDLTVILEGNKSYQIAQDLYEFDTVIDPKVKRKVVDLNALKEVHTSDWGATFKALVDVNHISLKALRKISILLESKEEYITIIYDEMQLLDFVLGREVGYGIAVDIGTTTVVAYLYNLMTGEYIDRLAGINEQQNFGFDVISRIHHAYTYEGLASLSQTICKQLNAMIETLLATNQIKLGQLDEMVIVGNTVMMHLLLSVSPKSLGISPFKCMFTQSMMGSAHEIGLYGSEHCEVLLLPHMAAYVGSDIVSGVIATQMDRHQSYELLLDIGTNGEMVLTKGNEMYCCATAAGPAFEGAKIECGVGGVHGAINKIYEKDGELAYTTIEDQPPIGICGSGIIDMIVYLLHKGLIDETGYLELEGDTAEFIIASQLNGRPIYISQKDIREVQLAKAAIRAGIETLFVKSGVEVNQISRLYLAGGFGNYMSKESAVKIGLIPEALSSKIVSVGNTAGVGAIQLLLDSKYRGRCDAIKANGQYIELSSDPTFSNFYVQYMSF